MDSVLNEMLNLIEPNRLFEVLKAAVNQYSPSFAEEAAMRVFSQRLDEAGIAYQRQPVMENKRSMAETRANLLIPMGPQPPEMLWVGHVDTVPLLDGEEQLCIQDGDHLIGLGTADMKSGCAAIIEALIACQKSGLSFQKGLLVALVVGEEEYGDGSQALLQEYGAPLTVIGEPTGLMPCLEHFGYYEYRLKTQGIRAHAALPEIGASAIHAMMVWIQTLMELANESYFEQGLAINLRQIQGGAQLFMVAESCECMVDIHAPTDISAEEIAALIAKAQQMALASHPRCESEAALIYQAPGYHLAAQKQALEPLQTAFQRLDLPWNPQPFRSHSDGSLFYQKGSVPVICGPGYLEVAHTRKESVSLRQTLDAARLYATMIYQICMQD